MVELINGLTSCKNKLLKHQPVDLVSSITDMNPVSFFNSKNIKTLQKMIVDPDKGGYLNLNYLTMLLVDFKMQSHSTRDTLFTALKNYIELYTDAIDKTSDIETNLFLTENGFENEELIFTAFALVLIHKHKQ